MLLTFWDLGSEQKNLSRSALAARARPRGMGLGELAAEGVAALAPGVAWTVVGLPFSVVTTRLQARDRFTSVSFGRERAPIEFLPSLAFTCF